VCHWVVIRESIQFGYGRLRAEPADFGRRRRSDSAIMKLLEREKRRAARLTRRLLALAAVSLVLALRVNSQPQGVASTAELARLFQVGSPSMDVAILVDASLSMRGHRYADVRQAVVDFTSTFAGAETLSLRMFGDVASAPLEGPANKIAGNVAAYLPAEPMFQNTDLGVAIQKALEFFERDGAGEAQALFLLTDGRHQPPPGSPYTRDFTNDPDWQALRIRAHALCLKRKVFVYGFGLGPQTDVSLLLEIFPAGAVEVMVGAAAQVATALRRDRERSRIAHLRHAVGRDLNTGKIEVSLAQSAVEGDAGGVTQIVTIRNRYRHLPIMLEGVSLQNRAGAVSEVVCELENPPRNLTLAPGRQWQGRLRATLRVEASNFRLGRVERSYRASVRLAPVARFEHKAEIEMLNAGRVEPLCDAPSVETTLRARHGAPYWLIGASLLAGLCLVLIVGRSRKLAAKRRASVEQRHAERKRLTGALKIWPSQKAEPDEVGVDLGAYKTAELDLAPNESGALGVAPRDPHAANVVAHLSGHLIGALSGKAESGRVEFRIEAARGHRLAYESGAEWRETARVILCDRDVIEIDGSWRLRYDNHKLRTRVEVESACGEGRGGRYAIKKGACDV